MYCINEKIQLFHLPKLLLMLICQQLSGPLPCPFGLTAPNGKIAFVILSD